MIEQLLHRIKIRQAEIQVSLAQGTPMNWEAYQRMVGEHQGFPRPRQRLVQEPVTGNRFGEVDRVPGELASRRLVGEHSLLLGDQCR